MMLVIVGRFGISIMVSVGVVVSLIYMSVEIGSLMFGWVCSRSVVIVVVIVILVISVVIVVLVVL